jgi:hypothetical protein
MSRCSRTTIFFALSIVWCGVSASAETMRCQSMNGNLNCSGSGAVACQTVNGKQVCVSGHGDVVQSFGGSGSSDWSRQDTNKDATGQAEDPDDVPGPEPRWARGHTMLLQQDGTELHLRTDRLSIDRD